MPGASSGSSRWGIAGLPGAGVASGLVESVGIVASSTGRGKLLMLIARGYFLVPIIVASDTPCESENKATNREAVALDGPLARSRDGLIAADGPRDDFQGEVLPASAQLVVRG